MLTWLIDSPGEPRASLAPATLALIALAAVVRPRRGPVRLDVLSPAAFERAVGAWLARDGWVVEHRGGAGDRGLDLLAFHGDEVLAVQCKRYAPATAVTPAQVRELYGAAVAVGATAALMVTTGRMTPASIAWRSNLPEEGPTLTFLAGERLPALAGARERLRPGTWARQ